MAGVAQALVDLCGTVEACKAWQAGALEGADAILAGATIQTRIRRAVINIYLTVGASVARSACTSVAAKCVGTCAPVSTGVLVTFINVFVASLPLPAWCTTASKALVVRCVVTDAIILTGIGETRGQHVLTVPASVR